MTVMKAYTQSCSNTQGGFQCSGFTLGGDDGTLSVCT